MYPTPGFRRELPITVLLVLLLSIPRAAEAQEIEPRAYANIPAGMNALALAYSWSEGNVVSDATLPLQDLELTAHTPALMYVRTFSLFGKLGRVQATVPYVFLSGTGKLAGQDSSGARNGFADARLRLGVNIFGSPALAPKDFQRFQQETIFGVSVVVSVPIGHYDAPRLVNIGSNRWGFKPELGVSHSFGRLYAEVYAGVWLTTVNDEFRETGTLDQDPIYSFSWHVSYVFKSGIWLAANGVHVHGGNTSVNGVYSDSFQKNWRLGATVSIPFTRQASVKVLFHTGVATRIGADFNILTIAYQYIWF
ncbi:MAG: transporter [Bacteroidota bacterium]